MQDYMCIRCNTFSVTRVCAVHCFMLSVKYSYSLEYSLVFSKSTRVINFGTHFTPRPNMHALNACALCSVHSVLVQVKPTARSCHHRHWAQWPWAAWCSATRPRLCAHLPMSLWARPCVLVKSTASGAVCSQLASVSTCTNARLACIMHSRSSHRSYCQMLPLLIHNGSQCRLS